MSNKKIPDMTIRYCAFTFMNREEHAFLKYVQITWSIPPWPKFGQNRSIFHCFCDTNFTFYAEIQDGHQK